MNTSALIEEIKAAFENLHLSPMPRFPRFLLLIGLAFGAPLPTAIAQPAIPEPAPNFLQQLGSFKGHKNAMNGAAFSPDGRFVATVSWDHEARIHDVATKEIVRTLTGHDFGIRSVAFTPDGSQLLTGSNDATARLWDVGSGQQIRVLREHKWPVLGVAISSDGQRALTCSDGFRLWNLQTGELLHYFTGHTDTVWTVAFSPDDKLALSGCADGTMRLWDLEKRTELRSFGGHKDRVLSVRFAPDGKTAFSACTGDSAVRQWNLQTGEELRRFNTVEAGVACLALSPDGQYLLAGEGQMRPTGALDWAYPSATVYYWKVADGTLLGQTRSIKGYISTVAFSPDGTKAVSGGYEMSVHLWDVRRDR